VLNGDMEDKVVDESCIIYENKISSNIRKTNNYGPKVEITVKCKSCLDNQEFTHDVYLAYSIRDFFENIASDRLKTKKFKIENYIIEVKGKILKKYRTFGEEEITNGSIIMISEKKYDLKLYPKLLKIVFSDGSNETKAIEMGYNFNTTFENLKSQIQYQFSTERNNEVVPYFTNEDGSELYEFGEVVSDYNFKDKVVIKYHDKFNKDDLVYKFRLIYENYLTHNMTVIQIISIKQLKHIISRLYKVDLDDFEILINDRFVTKAEENKRLNEYNLQANDVYELMIFKTIGKVNFLYEVLRFNQDLREKQIDFTVDDLIENSKKFFSEEIMQAKNIAEYLETLKEKYHTKYASYLELPLGIAVQLYTSNLMYLGINRQLKQGKYKECLTYLSYFQLAFLKLPLYIGRAYRGVRNKNYANHKKGENILWMNISSLSLDYNVALKFSKEKETQIPQVMYIIDVLSARYLDLLSVSDEKEVTLFPYSILEVTDIKIDKNTGMITYFLTEVPTPKSPKILCWVDDNPINNIKYLEYLEMHGVSTVCLKSNAKVEDFFNHHSWLLSRRNKSTFKIITDMKRKENNVDKPKAGIDTIKLIKEHKYNSQILVFTTNKERANEICLQEQLDTNIFRCEDKNSGIIDYLNQGNFIYSTLDEFKEWLVIGEKWDDLRKLNSYGSGSARSDSKLDKGKGSCYIY